MIEVSKDVVELARKAQHAGLPSFNSRAGKLACNAFFQRVRFRAPANNFTKLSAADFFATPEGRRAVEAFAANRQNQHLQTALGFYCKVPAQFPPLVWISIINSMGASRRVFVPFCGWGNSLLACLVSGRDAILCDCNPDIAQPFSALRDAVSEALGSRGKARLLVARCEDAVDSVLQDFRPDVSFSSPPFFKRGRAQEQYNGGENSKARFYDQCLFPLIRKLRAAGVANVMHLSSEMIDDIAREPSMPCARFEWTMPSTGYATRRQNRFVLF